MTRVIKRPLKDREITLLINDVRKFPDLVFVSSRLWRNFENSYVLEDKNLFIGVCIIYLFKDWVKIGPLVILRKLQGKGYGKQLFRKVVNENKNRNIFIASSNRAVERIVYKLGFTRVRKYFDLPIIIKFFLLKQLCEYLNPQLIIEAVRKRLFLKRGRFNFFIKRDKKALHVNKKIG